MQGGEEFKIVSGALEYTTKIVSDVMTKAQVGFITLIKFKLINLILERVHVAL